MRIRSIAAGLLAGLILGGSVSAIADGRAYDETDQANLDQPAPIPGPRGWIIGVTGSPERGQEVYWQNGAVTYAPPIELLNYRCRAHHRHNRAAARSCLRVAYARAMGLDEVQAALAGERTRTDSAPPEPVDE